MRIAVTGAGGFIGGNLSAYLQKQHHQVVPLGRVVLGEEGTDELVKVLEGCDAVIHLAGAPVGRYWSKSYKKELYDSRIGVTRRLVRALEKAGRKPEVMISASAAGYYPGEGMFDESYQGEAAGFLAALCRDWEKEARKCPAPVRLVISRFGLVLSPAGGAMAEMVRPLRMTRFSPVIGAGTQPFPWIGLLDLCRAIAFFLENRTCSGVYNLVAPQMITQSDFARALARCYGAWNVIRIPSFFFKWMYGERSSIFLSGQKISPVRLQEAGFVFDTPKIEQFLEITDKTTVPELDLVRYMGLWYEIARYENRFERGMNRVTASYTLLPEGMVRVENTGSRNGVKRHVVGLAKCPDWQQPGKLKVSFFLWFYSSYDILELDMEQYRYAVVAGRRDNYLWILSRTPRLSDQILQKLLALLTARGYNTQKLLIFNGKK